MHGRYGSRSIAVGGICLAALAMGGLSQPAKAQAMQQVGGSQANGSQASGSPASGFNALDPQWAFASPFMSSGFGASIAGGTNQHAAYVTKFGSGTAGLFVESNARNSGNFFGAQNSLRQDWFSTLGDPVSRTSMFGSYKSAPSTGLFDGLYTTASFGVTNFNLNPAGFSGLPGFSGNDVTAVTARAGVGLQLTPQISIEGSVGFTQGPNSTFR